MSNSATQMASTPVGRDGKRREVYYSQKMAAFEIEIFDERDPFC